LTTCDPSVEHDLGGLRESFDPRARWRLAITSARALHRLGSGIRRTGAGADKVREPLSDSEESVQQDVEGDAASDVATQVRSDTETSSRENRDIASQDEPAQNDQINSAGPEANPLIQGEMRTVSEDQLSMPGKLDLSNPQDGTNTGDSSSWLQVFHWNK
jgi:calcium/calmodulin-dependent protein kinase I